MADDPEIIEDVDYDVIEDASPYPGRFAVNLTRPVYLDGGMSQGLAGFGAAAQSCSPLAYMVVGALLVKFAPPFLGGLFSGARDAWRDRE